MSNKLEILKEKIDKKKGKREKPTESTAGGIDKYLADDMSVSDDSFEEFGDDFQNNLQDKEPDVSKLIDFELIQLLGLCDKLTKHRDTDDYENDICEISFELGKKQHDKLLIFDMDETLIAAKFG